MLPLVKQWMYLNIFEVCSWMMLQLRRLFSYMDLANDILFWIWVSKNCSLDKYDVLNTGYSSSLGYEYN